MGTTLAVLMVLGIFVGIPAVIGFAIVAVFMLSERPARGAKHAKVLGDVAEALRQQPAEVHDEAPAEEVSRERVVKA